MEIRKLFDREKPDALRLAREVFLEFEAPEYSEQGVAEFLRYLEDREQLNLLEFRGAFLKNRLVGMIAASADGHISLFFVAPSHHRKGIGRALFASLLRGCDGKTLTVNSSPYAVPVYRRLGFADVGEEQTVNGIRFTPMIYPRQRLHSYLFAPSVWQAAGTYYDADGSALPLTGEVELIRNSSQWTLGGWMEVAAASPMRLYNDYTISETEQPMTLAWESYNPALGAMRGTFELIEKYVLSSYCSEDGRYSGTETLIRLDDSTYENFGAVFDRGCKMSCWAARLTVKKQR